MKPHFLAAALTATILLPEASLAQYPPPPAPPPAPRSAPAPAPARQRASPERRIPDPPTYPRYIPPAPEASPRPPVGRRMLMHAADSSGLLLSMGVQRDLSAGAELHLRLTRNLGLGFGAQAGLAFGEEVICPTYGGTGRFYVGREQRFIGELGYARNRIDPYLGIGPNSNASCAGGEVNHGPEASIGYQALSRSGFVFEALGGLAFITNDALARRHSAVAPIFQLKVGYLFH